MLLLFCCNRRCNRFFPYQILNAASLTPYFILYMDITKFMSCGTRRTMQWKVRTVSHELLPRLLGGKWLNYFEFHLKKNCSEENYAFSCPTRNIFGHKSCMWHSIKGIANDTERKKRSELHWVFGLWHLLEQALPNKTNRTVLDTVLRLDIWYRNFQECDPMPNEQFVRLLTELKQLVLCYRPLLVCHISTPLQKLSVFCFEREFMVGVKNKKLAVLITRRYHHPSSFTIRWFF